MHGISFPDVFMTSIASSTPSMTWDWMSSEDRSRNGWDGELNSQEPTNLLSKISMILAVGPRAMTAFIVILSLLRMVNLLINAPCLCLGRVENRPELAAKTGLLEIAHYMARTGSGHFRLTGNQHLIITGITSAQLPHVKDLLAKYALDNLNFSGLRLSSYLCWKLCLIHQLCMCRFPNVL